MSSGVQVDAHTRTLEGPRPDGASDTPPSSQQEQEIPTSASDISEKKVMQALNAFLVDKGLGSSVSARLHHQKRPCVIPNK